MTEKELQELNRGDMVQHRNTGNDYVIIGEDTFEHPICVKHIPIINPSEWSLLSKSEKNAK
jgi:hypothetical protein